MKKPKNDPPNSGPAQPKLEMTPEVSPELQQVLTFETVEELLSYDFRETDTPERIGRKLRAALPQQDILPLKPLDPGYQWKPRPKD